ncbi:Ig-like domain-containing protein [Staphylococcus agnetis]|uniref:Ig-like domain-containing protein n=2 Tax=Staphylococcus agnetis TaxID=985762 RepID=UPI0033902527
MLGLSSEAQADELNDSLSGTEVEQPVNTDKKSEALFSNNQPKSTSTYMKRAEAESSRNVDDKVTFSEFELDKNKIHPNSGESTNLKVKMQVNGNVKGGDTFTFKVPEYVTLNGDASFKNLNNTMPMNPIINQRGEIIARGVYNTETKLVTYTFTNIVADRRNIRAGLELPNISNFAT